MKQDYNTLPAIVQSLNDLLDERGGFCTIQKIMSTAEIFFLGIRFKGESKHLWLGRGGKYQGAFLALQPLPANRRLQDRFLHNLRKNFNNARIIKFVNLGENSLGFDYIRSGYEGSVHFTWYENKLYYGFERDSEHKRIIFTPWLDPRERELDIDTAQELKTACLPLLVENFENTFNSQVYEEDTGLNTKLVKRRQKFYERKILNIESDLKKIKKWELLEPWIQDLAPIQVDELYSSLQNFDVHLKLNQGESFYQFRDRLFQKIKKMRQAKRLLKERLVETQVELAAYKERPAQEISPSQKLIQPVWIQTFLAQEKNTNDDGLTISIWQGFDGEVKIAMGHSAQANDHLRSQWAKKEDYWFHLESGKSPHVFIKLLKRQELTPVLLTLIASMMRDYGQLNSSEIDIIYTQAKNLKGLKGVAGSVTHSKTKHFRAVYNEKWREILSNL